MTDITPTPTPTPEPTQTVDSTENVTTPPLPTPLPTPRETIPSTPTPLPTPSPRPDHPTPLPTPTTTQPMPGLPDATWIEMDAPLPDSATVHGTYLSHSEAATLLGDALGCPDIIALDKIDDFSWWGYCEPALADDDDDDYTPSIAPQPSPTHTATVATPKVDHTPRLAETGASDVNPATVVIGVTLIVAGVSIMASTRLRRRKFRR